MNLLYAVIPIAGILAFAYAWNRLQAWLDRERPGWKKTPNFYSLALAVGITLFATQTLYAILLDPLGLDKVQVGTLKGAFDASTACTKAGRTPVLTLTCPQSPLAGNYSAGIGRIPYGTNATCTCSWGLSNETLISIKED